MLEPTLKGIFRALFSRSDGLIECGTVAWR
jgi:hypothetical protein